MTEIATVNKHGKRKTETKMTMRHSENGRRVKKEVCKEDDNESEHAKNALRVALPAIMALVGPPITSAEAAVIDTETMFGVAIVDAVGQHPNNMDHQPNQHHSNDSRTKFLGRFIPSFMIVSHYHDSRGDKAKNN